MSSSSDSEEVYKVEDIKGHKKKGNKTYYLIKWKGYPDSENTWEPEENLSCPEILKRYQQSLTQKDNKKSPKSPKSKQASKQANDKPKPKRPPTPKENKIKKKPITEICGCLTDSRPDLVYYVVKLEGEDQLTSLPSSLVRKWAPLKLAAFLEKHLNTI